MGRGDCSSPQESGSQWSVSTRPGPHTGDRGDHLGILPRAGSRAYHACGGSAPARSPSEPDGPPAAPRPRGGVLEYERASVGEFWILDPQTPPQAVLYRLDGDLLVEFAVRETVVRSAAVLGFGIEPSATTASEPSAPRRSSSASGEYSTLCGSRPALWTMWASSQRCAGSRPVLVQDRHVQALRRVKRRSTQRGRRSHMIGVSDLTRRLSAALEQLTALRMVSDPPPGRALVHLCCQSAVPPVDTHRPEPSSLLHVQRRVLGIPGDQREGLPGGPLSLLGQRAECLPELWGGIVPQSRVHFPCRKSVAALSANPSSRPERTSSSSSESHTSASCSSSHERSRRSSSRDKRAMAASICSTVDMVSSYDGARLRGRRPLGRLSPPFLARPCPPGFPAPTGRLRCRTHTVWQGKLPSSAPTHHQRVRRDGEVLRVRLHGHRAASRRHLPRAPAPQAGRGA